MEDGLLKDLGITLSKISHLPEEFRIIDFEKKKSIFAP